MESVSGRADYDSDTTTEVNSTQTASVREQDGDDKYHGANAEVDSKAARKSRYRSFLVRARTTVYLIGTFVVIIYLGHVPLMFMIFGIQFLMVRELYTLAGRSYRNSSKAKQRELITRRTQQWYFFGVAAFWMYFRFVRHQLTVEITANETTARLLGWVLKQHTIIAFALYTAGFVSFVLRLEKGYYLYQFRQYAWTHLILLFVFMPSSFFVSNIFDGIIWFLLPCSLVIVNDIGAYLAGVCIGRTPLIKLSPKKTWEGFIGGMLMTVACSWFLAHVMQGFKWMDLSLGPLDCDIDDMYRQTVFSASDLGRYLPVYVVDQLHVLNDALPRWLSHDVIHRLVGATFVASPMQLHAVVLAMFASIIAPFGGFFASGFKRGFKIKDFGDSIPGHGGMTDRMDCQVVMAVFSYVYFNNYVAKVEGMTVGAVMSAVLQLDDKAQQELYAKLGNMLHANTTLQS